LFPNVGSFFIDEEDKMKKRVAHAKRGGKNHYGL